MSHDIFRKNDTDELYLIDEKLDSVLTVIKPAAWATNIAILSLIAFFIHWIFTGNISHTLKAQGVLVNEFSIQKITTNKLSRVIDIYVENGGDFQKDTAFIKLEEIDEHKTYFIKSDFNGIVRDIFVSEGSIIYPGETILNIEKDLYQQDREASIFVSSKESTMIKKGMKVNIEINDIPKNEYGEIKGYVQSVSKHPVIYENIIRKIPLKELLEGFFLDGPVFEVKLTLENDKNTFSGFQWTSGDGPKMKISNGTFVSAQIFISDKKPIELIKK